MTPRIYITLAIIAVISFGSGAIVFGSLGIIDVAHEKISAIIAVGSMLVTGGFTAFVAQLAGAFKDLDRDR
jgi:hypothetical protein